MKRYGNPQVLVTDRLRSYGAALKEIGNTDLHEVGQYKNNRAENLHLPFRLRERGRTQFRRISTLQKFGSTHASVYNHFHYQRRLQGKTRFKSLCDASLKEWRQLILAKDLTPGNFSGSSS